MRLTFDRGTLVLSGPFGDLDPAELPGVLWDPRVRVWRAPACRYAVLRLAMGPDGIDDAMGPQHREPRPPPELRPYQAAALLAWEAAASRGIVVLPTGAGKTRVAVAAIRSLGASSLCLVPTRALLTQWSTALGECGQLGDGVRDLQRVTVSTFASARVHARDIGNAFELLVVDEAHHFGGAADEILEMYTAPRRLGLTATPPDDPARIAALEALVGPIVYRASVGELAGEWLAPFELIRISVDLEPDEGASYDHHMAQFRPVCARFFRLAPGAKWADFVAAAGKSIEGRQALASFRQARQLVAFPARKRAVLGELLERHQGGQVLVFTRDNATAYAVAREHLVHPITCDIGRAERREVLARFARGDLGALVSAQVLNEGVDVPDADVAILVGGSGSSREYVQRIGRVLRPREGKRALVYELVVTGTHEPRQLQRGRRHLAAP